MFFLVNLSSVFQQLLYSRNFKCEQNKTKFLINIHNVHKTSSLSYFKTALVAILYIPVICTLFLTFNFDISCLSCNAFKKPCLEKQAKH